MKKLVVMLMTVGSLVGMSAVAYIANSGSSQAVFAAEQTQTVTFVDRETSEVIDTIKVPSGESNIPTSMLPAGYYAENVSGDYVYFWGDVTGNSTVPVYKAAPVTVNYLDSFTGKAISSGEVMVPVTGNGNGEYNLDGNLHFSLPKGYVIDHLFGDRVTGVLPGKTVNVYVTNRATEKVNLVNKQTGDSLGSKVLSTSFAPELWNGYRLLSGKDGAPDYTAGVKPAGSAVEAHVRPSYDGKTVSFKVIDKDTKTQIGTSQVTFGTPDYYIGPDNYPKWIDGYDFGDFEAFESAVYKGFNTGVFQIEAKREVEPDTGDSSNTTTDNQITSAQTQYTNLVTQLGSGSSKDIQNQLDALVKRIATLEAEKAKSTNTKVASLSAAVTVGNKKVDVYGTGFKKTGRKLNVKSTWKAFAMAIGPDGQAYYHLGGNQFVRADAVSMRPNVTNQDAISLNAKATIKYVRGYSIQVWKSDFKSAVKNPNGSNKKLKHNTTWKVFGIVKHNGHVYYSLGGKQYIDAKYAVLK